MRIPKASEIVADHFRVQIVQGRLTDGDYLPLEGELTAAFGVSRPILREALRILEAERLITVVRGSHAGACVHSPSAEVVSRYAGYVLQSQDTTMADLYEARLAIEPPVVGQLAANPDPRAIRGLRREIERLNLLVLTDRPKDFLVGVSVFHQALVAASGNRTLTFLNQLLVDLVQRHHVDFVSRHPRTPEDQRREFVAGAKSFTKLVDLIAAGQVDGATHHWRLHLENACARWTSQGEGERIVDSLGRLR